MTILYSRLLDLREEYFSGMTRQDILDIMSVMDLQTVTEESQIVYTMLDKLLQQEDKELDMIMESYFDRDYCSDDIPF